MKKFEIEFFEDYDHRRIDAESFLITDSGALELFTGPGEKVFAVAPGKWISIEIVED